MVGDQAQTWNLHRKCSLGDSFVFCGIQEHARLTTEMHPHVVGFADR